ncbi:MAG: hypothetical protein HQK96_01760 [Nitrospirae bacterium]|nr:hypothetical protein [Nitrospirota bacterium]
MGLSEKKRQKKLAKRASKRKEKLSAKKVSEALGEVMGKINQVMLASTSPLHECLAPENLFEIGIGNVVISRKISADRIGISIFLVDVFCLGVKEALFTISPKIKYDESIENLKLEQGAKYIDPACAVKLIDGAVAYAEDLGFTPHRDYAVAMKIFCDINPQDCQHNFEFGKDGTPLFFAGPNDTPAKCKRIIETLEKRCGTNGYNYISMPDNDNIDG